MSFTHDAPAGREGSGEGTERKRSVVVPLSTAIFAVLAALSTLFAHNRSISALSVKNEAILAQSKASDRYAYYQARRVTYHLYAALLQTDLIARPKVRDALQQAANREQTSSLSVLADAKSFEAKAAADEDHAEAILRGFETLELASTLFEIAIVLGSISALSDNRAVLAFGGALATLGCGFLVFGLMQAR